jgi:prophage antirepressor-like protein
MDKLQIFNYEGKEVRVTIKENKPWWVLVDVCRVLEIKNVQWAAVKLRYDEKCVRQVETVRGIQKLTLISKSGLYSTITHHINKLEANAFKQWITYKALPAIYRNNNIYGKKAFLQQSTNHSETKILEKMYAFSEENGEEAKSVKDFITRFVKDEETESLFLTAVRDARFAGYKEAMKAMTQLFVEAQA